jgi:hypothetical protein
MLTAGCMKLDAAGRVIIAVDGVPVAFNGGTPTTESGAMAAASGDPEVFLASLPYVNTGGICARDVPGEVGQGGFARDSVGGLAFATAEPIAGYIAGIPVTADGRIAVSLEGPPPVNTSGFDNGFDQTAFH